MRKQLLYLIAVLSLAGGMVLAVVSFTATGSQEEPLAIGAPLPTRVPATATVTAEPRPDEPTPTPTPQGDPRLAALDINRLVIPGINVDAPIVVLGVLPDGTMASPDGPEEVAWYTFSAKPGQIGNVVLSGHLDYIDYGAAVFWDLNTLRPGDELHLILEDDTEVTYVVESVREYDEATAPVQDIVGPTANESITLITCSGSFDPSNLHYNRRLVVRGSRMVADQTLSPERPEAPTTGVSLPTNLTPKGSITVS
ncbi:MAG TPA: class F sortase [Dehalococcoidia bacterium]|nr:class F sortase [Dehalococcoidia bacterium]